MADPTPDALVRLLVNDLLPEGGNDADCVFSNDEITGFLFLEGGSVKRAAAQAIDTIADDEALASKYIRDHQLTLDGPKVADSLRKRAESLRGQAADDDADGDDGFALEVVDLVDDGFGVPELTQTPWLG